MAKITIVHQPRPGQNWGPGMELQSVRDACDAALQQTQREAEQEPEAEAGAS